jgi:hypothetical protein
VAKDEYYPGKFKAFKGWGPFTQTYKSINSFSIEDLPAKTESVKFRLISKTGIKDSVLIEISENSNPVFMKEMGFLNSNSFISAEIKFNDSDNPLMLFGKIAITPVAPLIKALTTDSSGFDYNIGTSGIKKFLVDSLPPGTYEVTFQILDATGNPVDGAAHIESGTNLISAEWDTQLADYELSLSSVLRVNVRHNGGDTAGTDYEAPINVIPGKIELVTEMSGKAFYFSGGNYIQTGPVIANRGEWTFEAWVKPEGDSKKTIYSEGDPLVILDVSISADEKLEIGLFNEDAPGNWQHFYSEANSIPNGKWSHILITLEGAGPNDENGILKAYINGDRIISEKCHMAKRPAELYAAIGRNIGSLNGGNQGAEPFTGMIDLLGIWDYPKSDAQIKNDMYFPFSDKRPGMLAYWRFDDDKTSGKIADLAGMQNAQLENWKADYNQNIFRPGDGQYCVTRQASYFPGEPEVDTITFRYTARNFPPRTNRVVFRIIDKDGKIIDSLETGKQNGIFPDSAVFDIDASGLPLSAQSYQIAVFCPGGNPDGIKTGNNLRIVPRPLKAEIVSGSNEYRNIGDTRQAARFSGNSGIDFFSKSYLLEDNFTIESWVFIEDFSANENVKWIFGKSPRIGIKTDGNYKGKFIFEGDGNNNSYEFDFTQPESSPGWLHFSFVRERDTLRFTLRDANGNTLVLDTEMIYAWMDNEFTSLGFIEDKGEAFTGMIDNFRIWDRPLDNDELSVNLKKSLVIDGNLLINWTFDDPRNFRDFIYEESSGKILGTTNGDVRFINNFYNPDNSDSYPVNLGLDANIQTLEIIRSDGYMDEENDYGAVIDLLDASNHVFKSFTGAFSPDYNTLYTGIDMSSLPASIMKIGIRYISPERNNPDYYDYLVPLKIFPPKPSAAVSHAWKGFVSGVELYNNFLVNNFHEKTDSVKISIKKKESGDLIKSRNFKENSIPYSHHLELDGEESYLTTSQKSTILKAGAFDSGNHHLQLWFKTSSDKGGSLVSLTRDSDGGGPQAVNLYLGENGSLHFGFRIDSEIFTVNSQGAYNDGKWHNVIAQFSILPTDIPHWKLNCKVELIVDGGKIDEKDFSIDFEPDGSELISGYWTFGGVEIDDNWPQKPENEYLKVNLSEFYAGGKYLYYSEYGPYLYSAGKTGIGSRYMYLPFSDGTGNTAIDKISGNNASIHGKKSWFYDNKISALALTHDMGSLETGSYDFIATVYGPGLPNSGYEYLLNEISVTYPWDSGDLGKEINLTSNSGFGYFREGSKSEVEFSFSSDVLPSDNKLLVQVFDGIDPNSSLKWGKVYDCSEYPCKFAVDMGSFGPEHVMVFDIDDSHIAQVPLFIKQMAPPKIKGNFGPFTQSIADGSMVQENTFSFVTAADDIRKVVVRFVDNYDIELDKFSIDPVEDDGIYKASFSYDMATLKPPFTNMYLDYYLGDDINPEFTEGPLKIEIRRTQPYFFGHRAEFSEVETVEDTVFFKLKTPFDVAPTASEVKKFDIDNDVPLFGSSQIIMAVPDLEAQCMYIISEKKLEFEQTPSLTYKIKIFTNKETERTFDFEEESSDECEWCYYKLKDNELEAIQRDLHEREIYIPLKEWYDLAKEINELINKSDEVNPYSLIIKPYWSFDIAFAWASEYQTYVGMDENGNWGSLGKLEPPEKGDDKSSHQYASVGGDLTISIGADLLMGLASVELNFTGGARFACGELHHSAGILEADDINGSEIYLEFSITAHELFGLFKEYILHPKKLASKTFGDEVPENFPKVKVAWLGGKLSMVQPEYSQMNYIESNPAGTLNTLTNPQPDIASSRENLAAAWLDQDIHTGNSSLKIARFDNSEMKFGLPGEIANNNNGMSAPSCDIYDNGAVALAWAQSRYNKSTIPEGLSLGELFKAHDIWFAIDEPGKASKTISIIRDDFTALASGRVESAPEIAFLDSDNILLIWKEAALDGKSTKLPYTILKRDGDKFTHGDINYLQTNSEIITKMELCRSGYNSATLAFIGSDSADADNNQIELYLFRDGTWTNKSVIDMNEGDFISDISLDFAGNTGIITWIRNSTTSLNQNSVMGIYKPSTTDSWLDNKMVLFKGKENYVEGLDCAISGEGMASSSGVITVLLELKEKSGLLKSTASKVKILTTNFDLNEILPWEVVEPDGFGWINDYNLNHFDTEFGPDGMLFSLSHEVGESYQSISKPEDGILFGKQDMNHVLRILRVNDFGYIENLDESGAVGVEPELAVEGAFLEARPNPANDYSRVDFSAPFGQNINLKLFNAGGKFIKQIYSGKATGNVQTTEVNLEMVSPGFYYLLLEGELIRKVFPLVIAR